jgi:hypothetical protein
VLTVVTAIFGPGFHLYQPLQPFPGCRFVCFTDRSDLERKGWEIIRQSRALSPRRSNRHVKTLLHRYVTGPTLYVDAEFKITGDPSAVVDDSLDGHCWSATAHPARTCLFDEAAFCIKKKCADSPAALQSQVERYRAAGMPENFGLWAGGIIARRGDQQSEQLGEAWWHEIQCGSERDQVSLPFVAWTLGLKPGLIPGSYTALDWLARKKLSRKTPMIRFDKYERQGDYHWRQYAKKNTIYRHYVDGLLGWVRGKAILDVGAGDGLITSKLDAKGIELDPTGVALAQKHGADVIEGDAAVLPFADGSFDAVLIGDVIEHLEDPFPALREAHRVLSSDGTLYITTPPAQEPVRPYHYREYTPESLQQAVEPLGFVQQGTPFVQHERIHAAFHKAQHAVR